MPLLLKYKVMHGKTASVFMVHLLETDLIMTQFAARFITRRQMREVLTSMQSYVDRTATAKRKQIPFIKDFSGLQICRLYTQCINFQRLNQSGPLRRYVVVIFFKTMYNKNC